MAVFNRLTSYIEGIQLILYTYAYIRYTVMAKTIAISDEVYRLLKKAKLPNESFSTVIKRNFRKGRISDLAGRKTISRKDWEEAMKHLAASEITTSRKLKKGL